MYIRIGIWAGGDPSNREGTITWAGGLTDYSQAPFTMYVKSVHISNYNPAKSYSYSDNSGSSKSIKLDGAAPKDQSPSSSESSSSTTSSPSTSSSGTSSSSSTTSSSATSFATTTSSLTHTTSADKSTEGTTTTAGHTSTGTSSQTTLSSITSSDTKQTPSASNQNSSSNHYVSMAPQANHTATDAPASISEGVAMPPIVKPAAAVFDLNDARILLILIFFVALFN